MMRFSQLAPILVCSSLACSATDNNGGGDNSGSTRDPETNDTAGTSRLDGGTGGYQADDGFTLDLDASVAPDAEDERPTPELWYASGDLLVYFELSREDGSVMRVEHSRLDLPSATYKGQNSITMLEDGSLLGVRLSHQSYVYHIPDPPRDGTSATLVQLGTVKPELEALHADCEGRIYAMDTGESRTSEEGNRLLLFTGDILAGDFTFAQVSDLSDADVQDMDDMGPGLDENGNVTDNPGLAIDSGDIYNINYETGRGERLGLGGRFGIHVLGGDMFDDARARVYVLSRDAELLEVNTTTWIASKTLANGPAPSYGAFLGHSGLAGPLTACETTFTHTIR